jgi:hypothetical protein
MIPIHPLIIVMSGEAPEAQARKKHLRPTAARSKQAPKGWRSIFARREDGLALAQVLHELLKLANTTAKRLLHEYATSGLRLTHRQLAVLRRAPVEPRRWH